MTETLSVYEFGDHAVALGTASPEMLSALRAILRPPARDLAASQEITRVVARAARDGWQFEVDGSVVRDVDAYLPVPRIAEELVATACWAAAQKSSALLISGAVLAKDGVALAVVGDDLDAVKVIGFHLHSRGWAQVSFGHAFVGETTLEAVGLRARVSMSSNTIDQIPSRYRSAVEKSLWYSSGFDITFYSVDPLGVHPRSIPAAELTHVVVLANERGEWASLSTDVDPKHLGPLGTHPMAGTLRAARLGPGTPISSCDALERWVLNQGAS